MSLATVVDTLAERLRTALPAGTRVGDARPTAGEVPAVTLSVSEVATTHAGLGRSPRGTRRGALEVVASVDLADPVVTFDGEAVLLLSPDRRTLTLPQGQLVRADGTDDTPLGDDDLSVTGAGGPFAVVAGDPAAGQVRPDAPTGTLHFGAPLPASGTLMAGYFLGRWDVRTVRFSGSLTAEVAAADATAAASLSRQVATLLDTPGPGFARLQPVAWGPAGLPPPGENGPRTQVLAFSFDFELEEPSLPSGGGLIRTIDVTGRRDGTSEQFLITREGSSV